MSKEKRDYQYHKNRNSPDYQYHKNRNSPDSQIHLLIDEYLSPKIRTQGQIRKKLKQRRDLNRVYTILQKRISHASESNLKSLLLLALSLNREYFLSEFLNHYGDDPYIVDASHLLLSLEEKKPNDQEQQIFVDYIIDNWKYDIRFLNYLNELFLFKTLDGISQKITEDGLKMKHLQALAYSPSHLKSIQEILRSEIASYPTNRKSMIPYLDLSEDQNQNLIITYFSIADINYQLRKRTGEYFFSPYEGLRIPLKLIHNIEMDGDEIAKLKCYIIDTINEIVDVDEDKGLIVLIEDIAKIDKGFSEALLIMLYQKTRIYTETVFDALVKIGSEFAYKELVTELLNAKGTRLRIRIVLKLLAHFPQKADSIASYAYSLDDISLTKCVENELKSLSHVSNTPAIYAPSFVNTHKFEIIPEDIEINELITNLALKISATKFYSAVGFVYSSGLTLLSPLIKYLQANQAKWEIIAGSLQAVNGEGQNIKMDKRTAIHLNNLLSKTNLSLFTFEDAFYHGKFYYLSNDSIAYAIIGSTNLSKNAFFDNRELDILFTVNLDNGEPNPFLNWYESFRQTCVPISTLNEDAFADLNWDSELNAFTEQFIKVISKSEVLQRIESLTDEMTKMRMANWLRHNPTKIMSVHNIRALENYIVFLYSGNKLAVFESFEIDNAYYVFSCEDFDLLLSQITKMSKTQMAKASMYKSKGYHIQDQERLQENVDKYFE